jgi:Na+-translocating ferredoxin:NAD+ oxidoreductase RNF subunit RnfB
MILAFSIQNILIGGAFVGVLGLVLGVALGIIGKVFFVKVDERELQVRECLPGNNCGGCGYAGCDGLAAAIAKGEAPVNGCPVANAEAKAKIGEIMGQSVGTDDKKVAFVKCSGTCDKTERKYNYFGMNDCRKAMVAPGSGDKLCSYGCMGFGSCKAVCEFDAISIIDGIAVIDKDKCKACGMCVSECPRHIIEMIPYDAGALVKCNSNDFGKDVKAACSVGCIGCGICSKNCPEGAIAVEGFLAKVDYSKCTGCGTCKEKCPVKVIQ